MIKHWRTALVVSGCILIVTYLGLVSSAGSPPPREKATKEYFHAVVAGQVIGPDVTIVIEGYTTREDAQLLVEASRSSDRGALQKALNKMNKGRFRYGVRSGNPLRIVQSVPTEKGRKITLVADRDREWFEPPPGSLERIADYPYTFAELDLDENGKGTGVLMPFARVRFADNGLLKIDNYSVKPWRLVSVTSK